MFLVCLLVRQATAALMIEVSGQNFPSKLHLFLFYFRGWLFCQSRRVLLRRNINMAPTVQPQGRSGRDRRSKTGEKQKQLLCRMKYSNTLPDIPFDPKFISYPFEAHRFVQYNPTSLERNFKYDLLTEHDLGVPIDLINPEVYAIGSASTQPDLEDERLLEEETVTSTDSKRSRHHNKAVSWLRYRIDHLIIIELVTLCVALCVAIFVSVTGLVNH